MKEVADREHLPRLHHPTHDAHPLANADYSKDDQDTTDYLAAWSKIIDAHPDWQTIDFPTAFGRTQELFVTDLRSPFCVLFRQLHVAHRIGAILAVHAGMTEKGWQLGIERLQKLYDLAWERQDFRFLHDFDYTTWRSRPHAPLSDLTCMVKPLPPSSQPLISQNTAEALYKSGVRALEHGHAVLLGDRIRQPGVQQCHVAWGKIADMNGDIGISSGFLDRHPDKPSDWGFIQFDEDSGQFTAMNPRTRPLNFGRIVDGEYESHLENEN